MILGASDKYFYYTSADSADFTISNRITIKNLDIRLFEQIANDVLRFYPEFAYQPVIEDNKVTRHTNNRPLRFVSDKEKGDIRYRFGTKDTNYYLFYFIYGIDYVTFTHYHGMSDVIGMMEYTRCVMYNYAKEIGFKFTKEELEELIPTIRDRRVDFSSIDEEDMLDPYNRYGDCRINPSYSYEHSGAFEIPTKQYPIEDDGFHYSLLTLRTDEVLALSKEIGVSVAPMMVDISALAIRREYNAADKPVIALLPVDYRKEFNSRTCVNFSDATLIPVTQEDENLSMHDRCTKLKDIMRAQMSGEYMKFVAGSKAKQVEAFENDNRTIEELSREKSAYTIGGFRPVTYGFTYPGKMSLLSGLDRMVEDIKCTVLTRGSALIGHSFLNEFRIQILCRNDEDIFSNCIAKAYRDLGLTASLVDYGKVYADKMIVDALEHR